MMSQGCGLHEWVHWESSILTSKDSLEHTYIYETTTKLSSIFVKAFLKKEINFSFEVITKSGYFRNNLPLRALPDMT